MIPSLVTPIAMLAASTMPRHSKRILLVDDDPVILQLLSTILTSAGYSVVSCTSGVEAVMQFRMARRFDLLLTDFQMPVMNGVMLANLLTGVAKKLPVLILSGTAVEEIPLWELWRKAWCFLPKPTNAPLLLATIDQLCGLIPIHMAELSITPKTRTGFDQ